MAKETNVTAVVVTYNRLELLKKSIECLKASTPRPHIVVVNNGSTDGTDAWLAAQDGITVITQENVGGSGGFHTGMSYAYENGADYIWCMDDDVFPRADCLAQLMNCQATEGTGITVPRRVMDGQVFTNDFCRFDFTHTLASMHGDKLSKRAVDDRPVSIAGATLEGPLIRREVVDSIGLPNKEFFIFCDDTDYCLRTLHAGYGILYVPTAVMDKHRFFNDDSWTERNRKKKWKRLYMVRNETYMNHHYGRNIGVRYVRGLVMVMGYIATALVTCAFSRAWQLSDVRSLWRAYTDGIRERLGKMSR